MKRYALPLGGKTKIAKNNFMRVLFTISIDELCRQLDEIGNILHEVDIQHRDINPGNLLFCEKDRRLKLIDFYWSITKTISPGTPSALNRKYSTIDKDAIDKIKLQLRELHLSQKQEIYDIKRLTLSFGKKYYDGSASRPGRTYQKIDIPFFEENLYHRKESEVEFYKILSLISITPESIMDVGCGSGYAIFNLMRNFHLKSAIGYEADPIMFNFLSRIKVLFNLKELELINGINPKTKYSPVDLTICMNIHMWLVKQFGINGSNEIISKLIKNSKEMFFQTAGSESEGRYRVMWLKTKHDIKDFLKDIGGQQVSFIKTKHGRHLFKIYGGYSGRLINNNSGP